MSQVWNLFTPREQEIGELLMLGLGNKEIGARLGIGGKTVKHRLNRMFMKAGMNQSKRHKRIELVVKLFEDRK